MKLIADSGSTKTHWCVVNQSEIVQEVMTDGINPYYQSLQDIVTLLHSQLLPELKYHEIDAVYFYGAGCSFPEKKLIVSQALVRFFGLAIIEVQSDLLAAARSLFQKEKGIACILGTGSNSCYYDGKTIVQNVPALGFILGDEGSGAVLGKKLVADCLKNQLPEDLSKKFLDKYDLTSATILDKVYKQPFPNRFLAKFTPFILENINEPSISKLVHDSFDDFFKRNIQQYPLENLKVGFVGSISWYFREILEKVAAQSAVTISEIIQNPMSGLVKYHSM